MSTPEARPPRPAANKRGVHLLLDDGDHRWPAAVWDEHVEWGARLVGSGGHVVELIRSDDLRPETWQPFFDAVARRGLIPIVRLATYKEGDRWWVAPTPDPDGTSYHGEAERVRRFLEAIVWRVDRVVVTVGNEPNRPDEWGGRPDPRAYSRYLRDIAQALRRLSTVRTIVLNAGLDTFAPSDGVEGSGPSSVDAERFLEGMVAEVPNVLELLDGWASHAYPLGPFGEHPSRQEFRIDDVRPGAAPRPPPPSGVPNRGINSYAWELWKLGRLGLRKELPVYVTESGWRHGGSQVPSTDAVGASVADERYREYVELAFDGRARAPTTDWIPWNDDRRVVSVALFALDGKPERWGHTNLLLLDPTGHVLGTHPAVGQIQTLGRGASAEGVGKGERRQEPSGRP